MADSIMDSLIYSLNATVPVFVVIVVGYLLKRIGWINQGFIEASNKINFKVTLPALLIQDMVNNNFMEKFEFSQFILSYTKKQQTSQIDEKRFPRFVM